MSNWFQWQRKQLKPKPTILRIASTVKIPVKNHIDVIQYVEVVSACFVLEAGEGDHVGDDAGEDEQLEVAGADQSVEEAPPPHPGHVGGLVVRPRPHDHLLHIHPRQVLLRVALHFPLLGFSVFHDDYSQEHIEHEDGGYDDEGHEVEEDVGIVVEDGAQSLCAIGVDGREEHVRPVLLGADGEQRQHRPPNGIEVLALPHPLPLGFQAVVPLGQLVGQDGALVKLALKQIHTKDGKHQPHNEDDNEYIDDWSH